MFPVSMMKSLPERLVNVKGYVAEVMATSNNNQNNYGSNYNHSTFFVKVLQFNQLFNHASPIDEIKIFVKVYPEKLDDFQRSITLGLLVEFLNVKQYFSADLNFVFRVDFRPQNIIISSEDEMDPQTSFRKRLAMLQAKDLIQNTVLSELNPKIVIRKCIRVIATNIAHGRHRDRHFYRCNLEVHGLPQQVVLLLLRRAHARHRCLLSASRQARQRPGVRDYKGLRAAVLHPRRDSFRGRYCDGLH